MQQTCYCNIVSFFFSLFIWNVSVREDTKIAEMAGKNNFKEKFITCWMKPYSVLTVVCFLQIAVHGKFIIGKIWIYGQADDYHNVKCLPTGLLIAFTVRWSATWFLQVALQGISEQTFSTPTKSILDHKADIFWSLSFYNRRQETWKHLFSMYIYLVIAFAFSETEGEWATYCACFSITLINSQGVRVLTPETFNRLQFYTKDVSLKVRL